MLIITHPDIQGLGGRNSLCQLNEIEPVLSDATAFRDYNFKQDIVVSIVKR